MGVTFRCYSFGLFSSVLCITHCPTSQDPSIKLLVDNMNLFEGISLLALTVALQLQFIERHEGKHGAQISLFAFFLLNSSLFY